MSDTATSAAPDVPSLEQIAAEARAANTKMLGTGLIVTLTGLDQVKRCGLVKEHHRLRGGRLINFITDEMKIGRTAAYRMLELWESGNLRDARDWVYGEFAKRQEKGWNSCPSWWACADKFVIPKRQLDEKDVSVIREHRRPDDPDKQTEDLALKILAEDNAKISDELSRIKIELADMKTILDQRQRDLDAARRRIVELDAENHLLAVQVTRLNVMIAAHRE